MNTQKEKHEFEDSEYSEKMSIREWAYSELADWD